MLYQSIDTETHAHSLKDLFNVFDILVKNYFVQKSLSVVVQPVIT